MKESPVMDIGNIAMPGFTAPKVFGLRIMNPIITIQFIKPYYRLFEILSYR